jgi:hypothetical protein
MPPSRIKSQEGRCVNDRGNGIGSVGRGRAGAQYPFGDLFRRSGMSTAPDLPTTAKRSWHRFLETYEPLRSELYRYSRYLTRSPWDAEDLVQDTLARAFVTLAQMGTAPANPRAWLFRVASNLWIDELRGRREVPAGSPAASGGADLSRPA